MRRHHTTNIPFNPLNRTKIGGGGGGRRPHPRPTSYLSQGIGLMATSGAVYSGPFFLPFPANEGMLITSLNRLTLDKNNSEK